MFKKVNTLTGIVFLSLSLLFSSYIFAVENEPLERAANIDNPLNLVIEKYQLKALGQAKFSVLFWDIYRSTLFTGKDAFSYKNSKQPLVFKIHYLKDISSDDLIARTVDQWLHLGFKRAEFEPFLPELEKLWPNIVAGDSLALVIDGTSSFYFNDNFIGKISEKSFGWLFLDIWLSPQTSQPKLRSQLLGES